MKKIILFLLVIVVKPLLALSLIVVLPYGLFASIWFFGGIIEAIWMMSFESLLVAIVFFLMFLSFYAYPIFVWKLLKQKPKKLKYLNLSFLGFSSYFFYTVIKQIFISGIDDNPLYGTPFSVFGYLLFFLLFIISLWLFLIVAVRIEENEVY